MTKNQCVLIVDQSPETSEVLETALARRGVRTFHACQPRRGLEMAEQIHPDLIVLDLEVEPADLDACTPFTRQFRQSHTPLVVLGTARRADADPSLGEFIRKPYDYGPLVRKIEELLARAETPRRRAA